MRFLSVCSGIEAASVAWNALGWKAVGFSEIEPFPSAVLAHHYPDTPNLGDMTKYQEWPDVSIDLLCGGTPCQSFSVAGLRKGLDDPRGNLMLTFGAIAAKYRPRWLVWENVPGVLSSNQGRDFGSFLGLLGIIGYGFAYRVLDAQYFRLAQRRKRVFVVGCLGDWRSAAAVLFERNSMSRNPAPSRQARQVAPTIPSRSTGGGGLGTDFDCDGGLIEIAPTLDQRAGRSGETSFATSGGLVPVPHAAISPALKARDSKGPSSDGDGDGAILVPMVAHALTGEGFDASEDGTGRGTPLVPVDCHGVMPTLRAAASQDGPGHGARSGDSKDEYIVPMVEPFTLAIRGRGESHDLEYRQDGIANALLTPNGGRGGIGVGAVAFPARMSGTQYASAENLSPSLGALNPTAVAIHENQRAELTLNDTAGSLKLQGGKPGQGYPAVLAAMQVRRLTPRECARLQGFPDEYLDINFRGKPAADGNKYKALGNSWAVPVVRWIGQRIDQVEAIRANREKVAA